MPVPHIPIGTRIVVNSACLSSAYHGCTGTVVDYRSAPDNGPSTHGVVLDNPPIDRYLGRAIERGRTQWFQPCSLTPHQPEFPEGKLPFHLRED